MLRKIRGFLILFCVLAGIYLIWRLLFLPYLKDKIYDEMYDSEVQREALYPDSYFEGAKRYKYAREDDQERETSGVEGLWNMMKFVVEWNGCVLYVSDKGVFKIVEADGNVYMYGKCAFLEPGSMIGPHKMEGYSIECVDNGGLIFGFEILEDGALRGFRVNGIWEPITEENPLEEMEEDLKEDP